MSIFQSIILLFSEIICIILFYSVSPYLLQICPPFVSCYFLSFSFEPLIFSTWFCTTCIFLYSQTVFLTFFYLRTCGLLESFFFFFTHCYGHFFPHRSHRHTHFFLFSTSIYSIVHFFHLSTENVHVFNRTVSIHSLVSIVLIAVSICFFK